MVIAEAIKKQTAISEKRFTLDEYFKYEEQAVYKSEFHNGKIIPMAGGTIAHARIITNILKIFGLLEDDSFEVYSSELKIYIPAYNHSVYSDGLIIVGAPEMYEGGNQAILNPTLIVEVLSDSTEKYDRGEKFRKYQTLPSFQEYMLIDQKMAAVDVLQKEGERNWRMRTSIGLDDEVHLKTIDATLKMSDIYRKVKDLLDPQTVLSFNPQDGK